MIEQTTMKAVVYHKKDNVTIFELQEVEVPKIEHPDDIIVRVALSTICGSDISTYNGYGISTDGIIIGHEFVGEIVEKGSEVKNLDLGDRVVIDAVVHCGVCYQCRQGNYAHCVDWDIYGTLRTNGCQTEFVRVPYANSCAYKIHEDLSYEDVLFVGDILSTGYFAVEVGEVKPGDTVVVFGAGPVGMLSMVSARLFSPFRIIAVDPNQSRLNVCLEHGLADIVFNPYDEVNIPKKVLEITHGRGADVCIEACGVGPAFNACIKSVKPYGHVSMVGLHHEHTNLNLPLISFKNINIHTGIVRTVNIERLMNLIQAGKINTNFLITHHAPLNDVMTGYDVFGNKKDGCLKWIITPYER